MMNELKCAHYNGDGFGYEISQEEIIYLCASCNLVLSGDVLKQVAMTAMIPTVFTKGELDK